MATETTRDEAIAKVIESAKRLGVELDALARAAEWVAAMSTEASGGDIVVDVDSGCTGIASRCSTTARRTWPASARWPDRRSRIIRRRS